MNRSKSIKKTRNDELAEILLRIKKLEEKVSAYEAPFKSRPLSCDHQSRHNMKSDMRWKRKSLKGLLLICSVCKKIKDDKGHWNQIEAYIHNHSEADFSHGICPECLTLYYPDFCSNE